MDGIPFDELDPCCQKEVESKRKNKIIYYPLLLQIRSSIAAVGDANAESLGEVIARNGDQSEDEEDDDDLDLELLDDMLTPYEQERLAVMRKAAEEAAIAESLGFAQHVHDSEQHVEDMITQGNSLVLHICNINSRLCARIDLALETTAKRYIGTLFRRITLSPSISAFKEKWGLPRAGAGGGECIAVFNKKSLVIATADLRQFGNESEVFTHELDRYLGSTHALESSIAELPIILNVARDWGAPGEDSGDELGGDDENSESYCGTPGCSRRFPHEHVGTSSASAGSLRSGGGGSTLTGSIANEQGAEALAKDFCFKI